MDGIQKFVLENSKGGNETSITRRTSSLHHELSHKIYFLTKCSENQNDRSMVSVILPVLRGMFS
jgi:hypothetical protein